MPQGLPCELAALESGRSGDYPQHNPLDLIERDLVAATIIELRRARALVHCHLLRMVEEVAVLKTDRDAGRDRTCPSVEGWLPLRLWIIRLFHPCRSSTIANTLLASERWHRKPQPSVLGSICERLHSNMSGWPRELRMLRGKP